MTNNGMFDLTTDSVLRYLENVDLPLGEKGQLTSLVRDLGFAAAVEYLSPKERPWNPDRDEAMAARHLRILRNMHSEMCVSPILQIETQTVIDDQLPPTWPYVNINDIAKALGKETEHHEGDITACGRVTIPLADGDELIIQTGDCHDHYWVVRKSQMGK